MALESWIVGDTDVHVEITGGTLTHADRTASADAEGGAGVDAGRDLDRVRLFLDASAIAAAGGAG